MTTTMHRARPRKPLTSARARPGYQTAGRRAAEPQRRFGARAEDSDGSRDRPLLAVDATGLLVRCSRARPGLCAPDGTPTGTLTLFVSALARQIRRHSPSHVLLAWDGPNAWWWRREMFSGYKPGRDAGRRHSPEADQCWEFCEAAGFRQVRLPGFEADDVLAWVTRAALHMPGKQVVLCSDDEDMFQLLDGSQDTPVALAGLSHDALTTAADVEARWGLSPLWLPKLRALAGDPSDGIPGLPGVGPKRALAMLQSNGLRWPLPATVIEDQSLRELTVIWRDIMDLVVPFNPADPLLVPECCRLAEFARWDPGWGVNALGVLERYGMTRIAHKLREGELLNVTQPA